MIMVELHSGTPHPLPGTWIDPSLNARFSLSIGISRSMKGSFLGL